MKWMMIVSMVCALAAGCGSNNGDGTSGGTLAGTKWRLTAWSASSSDPSQFTITADFSESQISGTSAVNSYGGPYTATADGRFSVGDLQSTLMGGSEEAMRAESLYFELLRQASKYAVTEATLTLKNSSNLDILIFNAR
jgi:heat shock protein HslJ